MSAEPFEDLELGATLRGFAAGQTLFGRFRLVRTIGRGGMGVVWLAQDEQLEREVALKFLPEMLVSDRTALEELKRETRSSLALTHHHIVRIFDFHQQGNVAGISMEYVDGDTLSNVRVEHGVRMFNVGQLGPTVKQLCAALDYAHRKAKIVHRDLKPANLMVNRAGELKVTDFGISASITESASRVSMRPSGGTLVYMSPQQLLGDEPSVADDIYSLGATLYDLITGKPPFYQGNIDLQVREKVPPPMAERREALGNTGEPIPREWEETISACLAKNPAQRPQSAGEVWERLSGTWQAVPEIKKAEVSHVALSSEPAKQKLRNKSVLIATLVVVLFAGGVAGWWFRIEEPKRVDAAHISKAKAVAEQRQHEEAEVARVEETRKQEMAAAQAKAEADRQLQAKIDDGLMIAKTALGNGRYEEARIAYKNVLALDAGNTTAKEGLGNVDKEQAVEAQRLAKEKEEAERQAPKNYELGLSYYWGGTPGIPVDYAKAATLIQSAANYQVPEAEARLALLFHKGQGVPKNEVKAQQWARKAVEHDLEVKAQGINHQAITELGMLYDDGLGVPQNYKKAVELYQKAAEHDNPAAETSLAFMYQQGLGVPQNYTKALELYQKASAQGNSLAQNNLAFMYENGIGVMKDVQKALGFYISAAEQGNDFAQKHLGYIYENGLGVPKNLYKAVEFYQKAADRGNDVAQKNLGAMYENGIGVSKDLQKAAELYQKASDADNDIAQNNLGNMFLSGDGVTKDIAKGVQLLQKAAEKGDAAVQYNLGSVYQYVLGGSVNLQKAAELYQKSADQGNAMAQNSLGNMYVTGDAVTKDISKGIKLLQKAAGKGNPLAQNQLGIIYFEGVILKKDTRLAKEFFMKAAAQGNNAAKENLVRLNQYAR